MRLRHRPDNFMWRGDEYDFHRHQDGASLPCLDRDTAEEQEWPLHSGWTLHPTGEEVRDIIRQVHGIGRPGERRSDEDPAPEFFEADPKVVEKVVPDPADKARIVELEEQLGSTVNELGRVVESLKAQAAQIAETPPEPSDGIPPEFRALMMPGESPERFTERMRRRWQALQHLRIDGTKPTQARALPDMTPEESEELADLEARNSQRKWLD